MSLYRDKWIECTPEELRVRFYYPWGTKRIPYNAVRALTRVALSASRGKPRIWGTANPRYWASLDPRRPSKPEGLILDLGRFVKPFITPDDAEAVEAVIREKAHLGPASATGAKSPFI
ncbi:MAG: hypothetical protein ACRDZX_10970 [Acidimicrobiales bacterium]